MPLGQDTTACTALVVHNSPPLHALPPSDDSTALPDELLVALAQSPSIDEATKQALHKLKVIYLIGTCKVYAYKTGRSGGAVMSQGCRMLS